nr:transposase (putative), gypsy type [Tanacetum cinerariifolium]
MVRDSVQLETAVNTISHEYLLEFTSKYGIPKMLHPELPRPGDRTVDFPEGKAQPKLATLRSTAAKRPGKNTPQCYTKPLDSLKNWNNRFFWVDERLFPTVVDWRTNVSKDGMPVNGTYSVKVVRALDTHRTPIQKQPEMLLCLVGISRKYYLGDEVYPTFHYDDDRAIDLFSLIRAPNPTKVKTGSRPRAPHEVPLLTLTASRVIEMDEPAVATDSSGVSSAIEKSPLDFAHEDGASDQGTATPEMPPPEDSCKRGHDRVDANAPPMSLRRDHADLRPLGSSHGGKSLAAMQLCLASNVFVSEGAHANVSDPDLLSFTNAPSHHPVDVAQSSPGVVAAEDPESENASSSTEVGSPGSVYGLEWGVTNGNLLDTHEACQDLVDHVAPSGYFSELRHMLNEDFLGQYNVNLARQVALGSQLRLRFEQEAKLQRKSVAQVARRDKRIEARELEIKNLEALLETEADMKRAAEDKSAGLIKELEDMRARFSDLQVSHGQLSQQVASLKEQVSGEEKLKAAFKQFKLYEDEQVKRRCAELDARLDALSIDFDEELYPHMLTAIAGRKWVVGHGLRLAMMKYERRPEAWGRAWACPTDALQSLKDLKYPLLDQLEGLKDAPMDSETGGDAPQYIRDLRPSSSQLTIPVYPEVGRRFGVCTYGGSLGSCPFAGGCGYAD